MVWEKTTHTNTHKTNEPFFDWIQVILIISLEYSQQQHKHNNNIIDWILNSYLLLLLD